MRDRAERRRRQARWVGAAGFLLAVGLPVALWYPAIADTAAAFTLEVSYFTGLVPWLLILAGLAFFVPVALSAGGAGPTAAATRAPATPTPAGGITLYLLGFGLATQVVQIHDVVTRR
jgi:hypothetical protein